MQLKLVTFDKENYSVSTQFISLEGPSVIEYRSPVTGLFSPSNTNIPKITRDDITAVLLQPYTTKGDAIEISKHQGAYLIDAGKTVEVINRPCDFDDIQILAGSEGDWEKEFLSKYIDDCRYPDNGYKYTVKTTKANHVVVDKDIWYRWIKGTSLTFKPSNQAEYDRFGKDPDYQFIKVPVGTDPNAQGFKLP